MRILLAGGNAFDAMVAASLAAAVVEPIASYSLAAEGVFMLYDSDSGDLVSLSGQGGAPGSATAEFYRSRGHERIPTGPGMDAPLSFTQPGIVDAFINMLERYGTMSFEEVAEPAIRYAEGRDTRTTSTCWNGSVRGRARSSSTTSRRAVGKCSMRTARFLRLAP